jgi:hypothetical protein
MRKRSLEHGEKRFQQFGNIGNRPLPKLAILQTGRRKNDSFLEGSAAKPWTLGERIGRQPPSYRGGCRLPIAGPARERADRNWTIPAYNPRSC